jgi:putative transposase
MVTILFALVSLLSFRFRSRASLELELVALRHQVIVLRRQRPHRLRLLSTDRLLWVWLYRVRPQVLETLVLVKPATVVKWHRKGFRIYWRWRSRCPGRPKTRDEIRNLIRQMSLDNPLWGAPRVHGELLKLGIDVSQATIGRVLSCYFRYYHKSRTHLSLNKDCPDPRRIEPPSAGKIVAFPEVGGLHYRYERRAA